MTPAKVPPVETTRPLDESARHAGGGARMAIWWLTPGAPRAYQIIDESRTTIGRGPDVTVAFETAGVSRGHAEIYRQEFHDNRIVVYCYLPRHLFHHIMGPTVAVRFLEGGPGQPTGPSAGNGE